MTDPKNETPVPPSAIPPNYGPRSEHPIKKPLAAPKRRLTGREQRS